MTAGEQVLTQNRRHLIQSGVRPELESQESEVEPPTNQNDQTSMSTDPPSTDTDEMTAPPPATPDKSPGLCRSLRNRKPPERLIKFVKS